MDRCFIGESPGGVGQSLYSSHLNAVYGHNHGFIDPSIWYDDQELRKQIEQFAGCFILTAQEAPETTKRMREDLYKKTMSADGMAGRRRYGYVMWPGWWNWLGRSGWKWIVWCSSKAFPSRTLHRSCGEASFGVHMLGLSPRNSLQIIIKTLTWTGISPKILPSRSSLFQAQPLPAAFNCNMRLRRLIRGQNAWRWLKPIAVWGGDSGLTEDKMRVACGLAPRRRDADTAPGLGVDECLSQEQGDELKSQLENVLRRIVEELFEKSLSSMTCYRFAKLSVPANVPNLDRDSMVKQLEVHGMVREIEKQRGKGKRCIVPNVLGAQQSLQEIIDLKCAESPIVFPEMWDMSRFRDFCIGHLAREHNIVTLVAYHDASIAKLKPKGAGKLSAVLKAKLENHERKRRKLEACEENAAKFLGADLAGEDVAPSHRLRCKQNPRVTKVSYRRIIPQLIRGRKYVTELGAQQCTRRALKHLCPNSIDLDPRLHYVVWCFVQCYFHSKRLLDMISLGIGRQFVNHAGYRERILHSYVATGAEVETIGGHAWRVCQDLAEMRWSTWRDNRKWVTITKMSGETNIVRGCQWGQSSWRVGQQRGGDELATSEPVAEMACHNKLTRAVWSLWKGKIEPWKFYRRLPLPINRRSGPDQLDWVPFDPRPYALVLALWRCSGRGTNKHQHTRDLLTFCAAAVQNSFGWCKPSSMMTNWRLGDETALFAKKCGHTAQQPRQHEPHSEPSGPWYATCPHRERSSLQTRQRYDNRGFSLQTSQELILYPWLCGPPVPRDASLPCKDEAGVLSLKVQATVFVCQNPQCNLW